MTPPTPCPNLRAPGPVTAAQSARAWPVSAAKPGPAWHVTAAKLAPARPVNQPSLRPGHRPPGPGAPTSTPCPSQRPPGTSPQPSLRPPRQASTRPGHQRSQACPRAPYPEAHATEPTTGPHLPLILVQNSPRNRSRPMKTASAKQFRYHPPGHISPGTRAAPRPLSGHEALERWSGSAASAQGSAAVRAARGHPPSGTPENGAMSR